MNIQNDNQVQKTIKVLKKHFISIFSLMILGGVVAVVFSIFFIKPQYSSTVDLLVNQKADSTQDQYTIQQADLQAINTYKDILKKPLILEPVLSDLKTQVNYKGSIDDLSKSISISNEANSQIITVNVKSENPYIAMKSANLVAKEFIKRIKKVMKLNNVTIVSKALPSNKPVSPKIKVNFLLGLAIGLVIGLLYSFIKELLNTKVNDVTFLTDELGLINLGTVYHIDNRQKYYHLFYFNGNHKVSRDNKKRV